MLLLVICLLFKAQILRILEKKKWFFSLLNSVMARRHSESLMVKYSSFTAFSCIFGILFIFWRRSVCYSTNVNSVHCFKFISRTGNCMKIYEGGGEVKINAYKKNGFKSNVVHIKTPCFVRKLMEFNTRVDDIGLLWNPVRAEAYFYDFFYD